MDSEDHHDGDDNAASRPTKALAWFQEKLASGGRIDMPGFCQEFGFTHEQDAHAAFSYPLASSQLPLYIRTRLSKDYEEWYRNEGAEFWASRVTDYKIDVSTKKTAGNLVDRSELLAESLLGKPLQHSISAVPGHASSSSAYSLSPTTQTSGPSTDSIAVTSTTLSTDGLAGDMSNLPSHDPDKIQGNIRLTTDAKRKRTLGDPQIHDEVDTAQNRKKPNTKRAGVTDIIGDPKHTNEDRPIEKPSKSANLMPNPFLTEEDAWKDFTFFSAFGQDTEWRSASKINYLADFKDYQRRTGDSLAMDMIADVSVGSNERGSFSKWLKDRHGKDVLKEARFKPQAFKAIEDMWPSWVEVTNRVFANDVKTYRDVCKRAAAEPNQEEAIVVYVNCVLHSYMHHFAFGDVISDKVNEREAFVDTTWSFVRTALTIAGIPTRMMEIPIDGNRDRKTEEAKQKGGRQSTARKADGVGLYKDRQLYIAEAAQLYKATLDKKDDDAWKVKRAMRDGWVSQLRRICETHRPNKLVVFGSTSHRDVTKFYSMDFVGCFRVSSILSMVVPLESGVGFAEKMKSCMRTCLEFALILLKEMEKRNGAVFIDNFEDREELSDLAASIPATSLTPVKAKD
ncbi:hypothetical protein BGX34_004099 [Mortierella sp. NVP85]|nr:hypothetical protein BGX34_004099 [Mortierella sp. NVP85]